MNVIAALIIRLIGELLHCKHGFPIISLHYSFLFECRNVMKY